VQHTAIEHILTETDAPYLPPVPFRGKRNESAYIYDMIQKIADLKSMSIHEVADETHANSERIFSKIIERK